MQIHLSPVKIQSCSINPGSDHNPFLCVNFTNGHWLAIDCKSEAATLLDALESFIAHEPREITVAEASDLDGDDWLVARGARGRDEPVMAADAVVLCDEDHSDDDTVLSGEIPASDSDAAVMEQTR